MSYEIKYVHGQTKPYKIIRKKDGKEVGASTDRDKAERSIIHREQAEIKEKNMPGGY